MAEFLALCVHMCELGAVSPTSVGRDKAGAFVCEISFWNWGQGRRGSREGSREGVC